MITPDKALAELCRRSFFRFLQEFWEVVIPEKPVWNFHIEYLCDELQYLNSFVVARKPKPYDLVINVPPGSTKSTIVSQMYNAWVWAVDPTQRIISSSYSGALSLSHSVKTRDIVTSDKYRRLFPEVELKKDQEAKSDYQTTKGGQRFTTSTGGTVTGMHGHQILIDDPINPQQAASKTELETANNFVLSTLATRKVNLEITPTVLLMQRLHEDDPTGQALKKWKKVKHICLPAEESEKVNPPELCFYYSKGLLDPVRLNKEVLEEAKTRLGTYGYTGQYGQAPVNKDGGIFKKTWFPVIDWRPQFENLGWNFVVDTAYTKDEENDPSGFIAWAEFGNFILIRKAEKAFLEFPDLVKRIGSFAQLNGYTKRSIIEIEPKASGKSVVQTIRKETKLNVKESLNPNRDKVARANDISPQIETGRAVLIAGDWNEPFLDEVCTFPKAPHDEYLDCLVMIFGKNKPVKKGLKRRN